PRPPSPTLFPYTTLFRSQAAGKVARGPRELERAVLDIAVQQPHAEFGRHLVGRSHAGGEHVVALAAQALVGEALGVVAQVGEQVDRKSTRLNSSHLGISY